MPLKYRETMRAQQRPDVYDGPNCDQHKPRWVGSCEGDMGDEWSGQTIDLAAEGFPPGSKVIVLEPECPECGTVPRYVESTWKCECAFDWHAWTEDNFS